MTSLPDRHLRRSPEQVLGAVREAAELWGGHWQRQGRGGRLALPVVRGLRRGVVEGRLTAEPSGDGTTLRLEIVSRHYRLNRAAVTILILGGLGGLTTVLWPFFPGLLRFAPAGAVLAVAAWLLVSSRLRTGDEADFLALVAELAESS